MMTPPPIASTQLNPSHSPGTGSLLACFDSGLGGVVFLNHVLTQWPNCPIAFVGDTAWIPYGDKPPEAISHRVDAIYRWLLATYPDQLSAFVLACNTSVGAALPRLQETQGQQNTTHAILHPVNATMKAVKPTHKRVGILATAATIHAKTYQNALLAAYPDCAITAIACPGWVDVIEAGQHLNEAQVLPLIQPVCEALNEAQVDAVILGCTHYGLLSPWLTQALSPGIELLDSAQCLAHQVVSTYQPLLATSPAPAQRLFCTQDAAGFKSRIALFGFNALADVPIALLAEESLLVGAVPHR